MELSKALFLVNYPDVGVLSQQHKHTDRLPEKPSHYIMIWDCKSGKCLSVESTAKIVLKKNLVFEELILLAKFKLDSYEKFAC